MTWVSHCCNKLTTRISTLKIRLVNFDKAAQGFEVHPKIQVVHLWNKYKATQL